MRGALLQLRAVLLVIAIPIILTDASAPVWGGAEFRIPNSMWGQRTPAISGNIIVWSEGHEFNTDIYAYDLVSGRVFPICANSGWLTFQNFPAIFGNIVVWRDFRNGISDPWAVGANWDIYCYDLSTSQEFPICTNTADQGPPAISANIVVWEDGRNGDGSGDFSGSDIYGYDLATGREFPICTAVNGQASPAISDNIIVWEDWRNDSGNYSNIGIYGYDLATGREFPICSNSAYKTSPAISGNIVVWVDWRNDPNGPGDANDNPDIYGYDLSTSQEFPICTNVSCQSAPAISGSIVVWEDWRNGSGDIYGYDLSTGREFPICINTARQVSPAVSGSIVVWEDWRYGSPTEADIYGYDLSTPTIPPTAPTNLRVTGIGAATINLAWTDKATNESGFKIERRTGSTGTYSEITTVGANVATYSSDGLAAGTNYYYRVRAYNEAGNSAYSNSVYAKTFAAQAPSNLTATAVSKSQINLTWTDNSNNESSFKIYRKKGLTGTWALVKTTTVNATYWSNTGLSYGSQYFYRVRAYNSKGYSAYSNEANATTLYPVVAPANLTAVTVSSSQINLSWTDNSTNESSFKIYRKKGATGTWALVKTTAANATSWNNTGLSSNSTYYYRLRGYNSSGYSAYSNEVNATTLPPG